MHVEKSSLPKESLKSIDNCTSVHDEPIQWGAVTETHEEPMPLGAVTGTVNSASFNPKTWN
jgi:hypothetical protein